MAPVPRTLAFLLPRTASSVSSVSDLNVSSLELDSRSSSASSFVSPLQRRDEPTSRLSPIEAPDLSTRTTSLKPRAATSTYVPLCPGCKAPQTFNNAGFMALFAFIGAAMVVAAIWFFFWAKNGGFHFQQGDWDDYKTTVLRRKGPDGKTLSNATKSTRLGGGSVVHGQQYKWQKSIAKTVVGRDEKGRKGVLGKRGALKTHSITYSDDYMTEFTPTEMSEVRTEYDPAPKHHSHRYRDKDVRAYKAERPARVGGLNRVADGSSFAYTDSARSDTYTESSEQPLVTKAKKESKKDKARQAHEEAAKMEKRWKKEAEEAAAKLAAENRRSVAPKKSASPSKPTPTKQRRDSRSASPKKRDFSYQAGPASEVLSTAYTNSNSNRSSSYYEEYRPKATANPREERNARRSHEQASRSRQSSPRKSRGGVSDSGTKVYSHKLDGQGGAKHARGGGGGRDVMAGYRRGMDSLADSDED